MRGIRYFHSIPFHPSFLPVRSGRSRPWCRDPLFDQPPQLTVDIPSSVAASSRGVRSPLSSGGGTAAGVASHGARRGNRPGRGGRGGPRPRRAAADVLAHTIDPPARFVLARAVGPPRRAPPPSGRAWVKSSGRSAVRPGAVSGAGEATARGPAQPDRRADDAGRGVRARRCLASRAGRVAAGPTMPRGRTPPGSVVTLQGQSSAGVQARRPPGRRQHGPW